MSYIHQGRGFGEKDFEIPSDNELEVNLEDLMPELLQKGTIVLPLVDDFWVKVLLNGEQINYAMTDPIEIDRGRFITVKNSPRGTTIELVDIRQDTQESIDF